MKLYNLIILLAGAVSLVHAQDFVPEPPTPTSPEKPIIAVPLFVICAAGDSAGDRSLPSGAKDVATDATTAALASTHRFRVLTRSTPALQMLDAELLFQGTAGSVAAAQAFQVLNELNASYILLGRVNRFRVDETKGQAYGVTRHQVVTSISMDLQLINVNTQEIIAGCPMMERIVMRIPEGVSVITHVEDWEPALRAAIAKAVPKFINDTMEGIDVEQGKQPTTVISLKVHSSPTGADVEFDGNFLGTTPCEIEIPVKRGTMTISLAGYEPWTKVLLPNEKMQIRPTLKKIEQPKANNGSQQAVDATCE